MSETDTSGPAVVLLSGGLDSMVTAAIARERGMAVHALTIDYGQRHIRELQSARSIAEKLGVKRHVELPLDLRQFGGSALTDDIDVPKGGVGEGEDIPVTYVPARNLVFLALTTAFAETSNSRDIFIGVNALDYSGYPDCRPEFIASFAETARLGRSRSMRRCNICRKRISHGNAIGSVSILHGAGRATIRRQRARHAARAIRAGCAEKALPKRD